MIFLAFLYICKCAIRVIYMPMFLEKKWYIIIFRDYIKSMCFFVFTVELFLIFFSHFVLLFIYHKAPSRVAYIKCVVLFYLYIFFVMYMTFVAVSRFQENLFDFYEWFFPAESSRRNKLLNENHTMFKV